MATLGLAIEHADEHEAVLVRMEVPDVAHEPVRRGPRRRIAALFDTALAVAIARRLGHDGPASRPTT